MSLFILQTVKQDKQKFECIMNDFFLSKFRIIAKFGFSFKVGRMILINTFVRRMFFNHFPDIWTPHVIAPCSPPTPLKSVQKQAV